MVLGFLIATLVVFSLSILINLIALTINKDATVVTLVGLFVYLVMITANIFAITQVV